MLNVNLGCVGDAVAVCVQIGLKLVVLTGPNTLYGTV